MSFVFSECFSLTCSRHSLGTEIDIQGTYLAYEPIQSYGPCLQICTEDAEELHAITDGFSVSALKVIYCLLCKVKGFKLTLCFYAAAASTMQWHIAIDLCVCVCLYIL